MKKQNAIRVFQLVCGVTLILLVAGIVVPSLLLTRMSESQAGFSGSLHMMNIAGMTFTYKLQNILSAILGAAFGTVTALVLATPAVARKVQGLMKSTRLATANAHSDQQIGFGAGMYSSLLGGFFALFNLEA